MITLPAGVCLLLFMSLPSLLHVVRHAELFRDHLFDLPENEEVWVMDYIENFSCFQEFALQQDHFGA